MQSHRGFSDCTLRHAKGVSRPHCPTATTTRSAPAARARDVLTSGAAMMAAAAMWVCLRNVRRSVVPIIIPPCTTPMVGRMVSGGLPSVKHPRGFARTLLVPRAAQRAERRFAVGVTSQGVLVEIDAEPRSRGNDNVAVLDRQCGSADRPSHVLEIDEVLGDQEVGHPGRCL